MINMVNFSFQILVFALCTTLLIIRTQSQGHIGLSKKHVPLFIFGDSIYDAGNNNYINTTAKANYWPYGETFFKYPTGRFSDGRIIPDFIAEYAKLPLIPPYLLPGNHEFIYGVNFASAGAGSLVETRQGMVIDLHTQLSYFESVRKSLRRKLGDEEAKALLSRAVHLFSIGINDYLVQFETNSSTLRSYSPEEFVGVVIGNITAVIKEVYKKGGRNFGFFSIWPIACIPVGRVLEGKQNGACFDEITPYVTLHNKAFSKVLESLQNELDGFRYSFSEFHDFLKERMDHPSKYGFEEGKAACCGSGPYRGILSCGGKRGVTEYELCDNVTQYVFFDSAHATERLYGQFAMQFWSGPANFTAPYNLKALFESNY